MENISAREKIALDKALAIITDFADELANSYCSKSAIEIIKIKQDLQKGIANSDTRSMFANSFALIEKELFGLRPTGQYGKECFAEFMELILMATKEDKEENVSSFFNVILPTYKKAMSVQQNIRSELQEQKRILEKQYDIKDVLVHGSKEERTKLYHMFCYTYGQVMEGIFDEITRIYYFLYSYSKGTKVIPDGLEASNIYIILLKGFKIKPGFLSNWEDKKTIRNAIAHATHNYDATKDRAQFTDEKSLRTVTRNLYEFFMLHQELLDALVAFRCSLMLYIIGDAILFVKSLESRQK